MNEAVAANCSIAKWNSVSNRKNRCHSGQLIISEPLTQRFATALSLIRASPEKGEMKGAVRFTVAVWATCTYWCRAFP